jgi:hypothetical protein
MVSEFGIRHPRDCALNHPNKTPLPPSLRFTENVPLAESGSLKVIGSTTFAYHPGVVER